MATEPKVVLFIDPQMDFCYQSGPIVGQTSALQDAVHDLLNAANTHNENDQRLTTVQSILVLTDGYKPTSDEFDLRGDGTVYTIQLRPDSGMYPIDRILSLDSPMLLPCDDSKGNKRRISDAEYRATHPWVITRAGWKASMQGDRPWRTRK